MNTICSKPLRRAGRRLACRPLPVLLACVLALPAAGKGPAGEAGLVGKVVPPYPEGLANGSGSCVPHAGDVCAFSVGTLVDGNGVPRRLVAEQRASDDARPTFRILDALPYPQVGAGEELIIGLCERDGVEDAGMLAVAKLVDDAEWLDQVRLAWRLDPATRQLVAVEPAHVRCQNLAAGL